MRFIMMYVYPHTLKGLMQTAGTTVCSALMRFVVRRWCDILWHSHYVFEIELINFTRCFLHKEKHKEKYGFQVYRKCKVSCFFFINYVWSDLTDKS